MTAVPDYVPMLIQGCSTTPTKGGCLVQVANWLADPSTWTDEPVCVHPFLAHHAVVVNDLVDDDHRHQLALLAPRLAGTTDDKPAIMRAIAWAHTHIEPYKLCSGGYREVRTEDGMKMVFKPVEYRLTGTQQDAVDWLVSLLDQYDRAVGRTVEPLPRERWDEVRELLGQK